MSLVSNNIKSLRRKHQYTQEQFAQKLGIKRSLLGAYEEARAKPRLEILVRAATLFNVSVDQLVAEDLNDNGRSFKKPEVYSKAGKTNHEAFLIKLIEKEEQPHYFVRRDDQQYLEGLSHITLPMLKADSGVYRAFEVADDAMLPVEPGTVVVGRRVDNLQTLRNGQVYVVITREGTLLRTVYNRIQEDGTLQLHATQPSYNKVTLSVLGKEVEVWEVLYYISQQMPFGTAKHKENSSIDLPQLTALVLDLQQEVLKLKGEMKNQ